MNPKQQMFIEWQCRKLATALPYYLDHHRYEALIALFTPDGVFDRIGHVSHGHDALREALNARDPSQTTRHFTTNHHFTHIDENRATAIVYGQTYGGADADEAAPVPYRFSQASFMEFHDVYVQTPSGWRIQERIAKLNIVPKDFPIQSGQDAANFSAAGKPRA